MKDMHWLPNLIRSHGQKLVATLAVFGLILLYQATQKQVTFHEQGMDRTVSTHARTVGALLKELNTSINPGDRVSPSTESRLQPGLAIYLKRSVPVHIDDEGKHIDGYTTESTPENILAQLGVRLFPGDSIRSFGPNPSGDQNSVEGRTYWLRLDRGQPLDFRVGSSQARLSASAATLGEALFLEGIEIYEGDHMEPGPETGLENLPAVGVVRSSIYTIQVDGNEIVRRSNGENVAEILASANISLVGQDYCIPALGDETPEDGKIQVVRVRVEVHVELEPVPFGTVYQPAADLELDTLEVLEAGTFGVQSNTIHIRYEDGVEISRSTEAAVIAVEPKPRVIGYGTKIVVRTLGTPQGTIEYWRAIPIYATSYSPCNLGVPWCGTRTASGKEVVRGIIGVIRSWYNQMRGWSVFVPGYGPGTFEDIGGGIAGRDWIDLGFTDEGFEPWHQWTTLYFLTPVPPLDSIPWILP